MPTLGEIVWQLPEKVAAQIPFHAYIYKNEQGRHIGYIRIPDYMADENPEQAAMVFAKIMALYEKKTEALVIDQVNNPGGSVFYLYQLLSFLTTKELKVPPHKMLLGGAQVQMALSILEQAKSPDRQEALRQAIMERMFGFQSDKKANPVIAFAEFILDQFNRKKKRLSDPVALFGVDTIQP